MGGIMQTKELLNLMKETRSHRSFYQVEIPREELELMIEGARMGASTKNSQELRFAIINEKSLREKIFPNTKWAGMLSWNPVSEEAPTAYILICTKKELIAPEIYIGMDVGIGAENISLVANSMGYGSCMIGAYNKKEIETIAGISEEYKSHLLIGLGKPRDTVTIVDAQDGKTNYYREGESHFVPKISLKEIIL